MVKINATDLKGFKLVLMKDKEVYPIATLDSVVPKDAKNELRLHLVQGNKWSGDIVADMPNGRVLCIKGSIFSRLNALAVQEATKVGQIL